jgi:nucleotide-binding universal stress UspA family protein
MEVKTMIKRILVGLGGTPFTDVAVQRAVELACLHGSHLTGVTVVELEKLQKVGPVPPGAGVYAQRMAKRRIAITRERVEEAVAAFENACRDAAVSYSVERETGKVFDLMISHARYHDLTIFGLKSLFDYGLTDEPKDALIRLVSSGVRPILAVSPRFREVKRALVAYSGSMASAKTMRRFVQMRLWPDVHLTMMHCSQDATAGKALLASAADYCRAHGYAVETRFAASSSRCEILDQARQVKADIIVMGNSIHSLLVRQIMGSTALSTIENADRPLFLAQ